MKKSFRDRKDGARVRDIDGLHALFPHLMPNRCDAEVYLYEELDVTNLVDFLEKKNAPGAPYKTTAFHAFTAALSRVLYHRPLLNRFISGKRYYQRNKITLAFIVKRKFQDESEESLMITEVDGNTTLEKLSRKILGETSEIRSSGGNDVNDVLDKLALLPKHIMSFAMVVFRFLDSHGWMPESLCRCDSNYATVLLSNLGSIRCNAAYHHLNNYGTNSIVITIGKIHEETRLNHNGQPEVRHYMPIGATVDERIADGFYFAKSIKMLEDILSEPHQLEQPIMEDNI